MSLTMIKAFESQPEEIISSGRTDYLEVSEFFADTIQGEGVYTGHPATFLRLKNCTLHCAWCDTKEVWRTGHKYSFYYLCQLLNKYKVVDKLRKGQHLILTGGSPLLQQERLYYFIQYFINTFKFKPFIEIENEVMISPSIGMLDKVDCWNNSPKLKSSKNINQRKPSLLKQLSNVNNSWFKFVVTKQEDLIEIFDHYLNPGLIRRDQVILMPEGATRAELQKNSEKVVQLAIMNNLRYSSREHVILWDLKTGV